MVITNSGARDQGWFFSPPLMRGVKVDYQKNGLSVNSRTGLLYRDLAFWFVTFFFFFLFSSHPPGSQPGARGQVLQESLKNVLWLGPRSCGFGPTNWFHVFWLVLLAGFWRCSVQVGIEFNLVQRPADLDLLGPGL